MNRPAFYLALVAFVAAVAVPALMGFRRRTASKSVLVGAAVIALVTQSVAVLGFLHPTPFGLAKADVRMPDAPDVLPTALSALIAATIAYFVGKVAAAVVGTRPR